MLSMIRSSEMSGIDNQFEGNKFTNLQTTLKTNTSNHFTPFKEICYSTNENNTYKIVLLN